MESSELDELDARDGPIEATVTNVINGTKGDYAVALSDQLNEGSITFTITPEVWQESRLPTKGDLVLLSQLSAKRRGKSQRSWRSYEARFVQPNRHTHQHPATSKGDRCQT